MRPPAAPRADPVPVYRLGHAVRAHAAGTRFPAALRSRDVGPVLEYRRDAADGAGGAGPHRAALDVGRGVRGAVVEGGGQGAGPEEIRAGGQVPERAGGGYGCGDGGGEHDAAAESGEYGQVGARTGGA